LAAEQAAVGNPAAAHASILRGLRLGQQRPPVAMAAGDLALRIGDRATAMTAFASAVSVRPSLAADPWWSSNAAREAVFPDVITGAIARNETGRWEVELMAGRAVTTTVPLNQQIAAAWRGDTTAADALVKACDETPLDLHLGAWCARVLRHLGDATGAERFTERSRIAGQSAAEGTFEWRVTQSDSQGFALSPFLWPTYTYRRPGPQEALVDSLIHLHLE
jgi:hypothetical protein